MKQSYQSSDVPCQTFCSLPQKFSRCTWETCLIEQPPPEEKTVGFKFPPRHHPQPALLSNQTNRSTGCSSFKPKEWVGKFTVTKIQAHSNWQLLLILPDIYQNTFCIRGFAKPAVREGALFGCCTDKRRSATGSNHHCTISEPFKKIYYV